MEVGKDSLVDPVHSTGHESNRSPGMSRSVPKRILSPTASSLKPPETVLTASRILDEKETQPR